MAYSCPTYNLITTHEPPSKEKLGYVALDFDAELATTEQERALRFGVRGFGCSSVGLYGLVVCLGIEV